MTVPDAGCPACGAGATSALRAYRGRSPVFAGRALWHCAACGFHFVHPMPSDAELARYNAAYFENAHGGIEVARSARPFHAAINQLRVEHVERARSAGAVTVRRVLEIGPGLGDFSRHWLRLHPDTDYHVVESDAESRRMLASAGIHVHADPVELEQESAPFDLLVMSHVLEHMNDPRGILTSLVARVRPGGLVFIEVPCRDHEHKEEDEPHLLFFDREPMARLFARCGIEPVGITYHGVDIDRLRGGRFTRRSLARRVLDGVVAAADRRALLPVPAGLRTIRDAEQRAALRPFQPHVVQSRPAWWLRAVGRVSRAR